MAVTGIGLGGPWRAFRTFVAKATAVVFGHACVTGLVSVVPARGLTSLVPRRGITCLEE
ncbi:MAG: hypothetical protein R2708_27835 [Vicinamibacterales bacterium]